MAAADQPDVTELLGQIAHQGDAYKKDTLGAREALLASLDRLTNTLLTPMESMLLTHWMHPTRNVAIRIACECHLFQALAADGGSPKHIKDIKTDPPADPSFLGRLLRHLAATGILQEPQADVFAPTPVALALATERFQDVSLVMHDRFNRIIDGTLDFVKQSGYKAPDEADHTAFHLAYKAPPGSVFAYFAQTDPLVIKQFASMMQVYTLERPQWFQNGYYPVADRLIQGAETDEESVFLVDLGCGSGHDATRLLEYHKGQIPGKVVVQDRPEVIEIAKKEAAPEIVKMPHDFLSPQPVKGARGYFMHSIMHDWPDAECRTILNHIVPAMKPGYSKLLINDVVIADKGAHWLQTTLDFLVMASLASRERTTTEWHALVEGTGLKITGIFTHPHGNDSLIEMELI